MTRHLEDVGVAVTRAGASPGRLGRALSAAGAVVTHWPSIRFAPPEDPSALVGTAELRAEFDWLVLASPRAARAWVDVAGRMAGPEPKVAVAGPATADVLHDEGRDVTRVAEPHSARGLILAFSEAPETAGASILLPQSDRAGPELADGLRRLGATVTTVIAYRTVGCSPDPDVIRRAARDGSVRVVTFTSPSTVEGFLGRATPDEAAWIGRELRAAAIGPTTGRALEQRGWPACVARTATVEGLVEAAARAATRTTPRHLAGE